MLSKKTGLPFSLPSNPRNLKSAQFLGFAAAPLLLSVFFGVALSVVEGLGLILIYGASIWLLTLGLRAEDAYHAAPIARKPKPPLKLLAAVAMGVAVAVTVYFRHGLSLEAALVGLVASGLFITAFGIDPLKDKSVAGSMAEEALRANDVVSQAKTVLHQIEDCIATIGDAETTAGFMAFRRSADRLFRILHEAPERHRDLRRHLGVYLDAARDATDRFSVLYTASHDPETKARYLSMLDGLKDQFDARAKKYLAEERAKLDVELDVLQSQLASDARKI